MTLGLYSRRAMSSRPGRTLLTAASIMIGVTAVVAVTIVTAATRESYKLLLNTVRGRTALEVVAINSASIPEDLASKVAAIPGVSAAVPVVQQFSMLAVEDQRVRLQVMGIDPEKDQAVREMTIISGRKLEPDDRDKLMLEYRFARQLNVEAGDAVRLLTKRRLRGEGLGPVPMEVVGLVEMEGGGAMPQLGFAFMTLRRSQVRFVGRDKIDAVELVLNDGVNLEEVQSQIQSQLPEGLVARPPKGSNLLAGTLEPSKQGLTVTTVFSLLLAAFIILNTFLMNVSERRRSLAIMRVIGATPRQLTRTILRESLAIGIIGTAVGIGVGLVTAILLIKILAKTLDVSLPSATQFMSSPLPYILAVIFGLSLSVIGALIPALRAGRVSPLEGMSWVVKMGSSGTSRRNLLIGFVLFVASSLLIGGGIAGYVPIEVPTYAAVGLLVSLVLMLQAVLGTLAWVASAPGRAIFPAESELALRQVMRHRGRSALTAGVLFIAGSTGVGMANSIMDNVRDVREWYHNALIGDYYVRAMLPDMSTGRSPDLPEGLDTELRDIPGIAYMDRVKLVEVPMRRPLNSQSKEADENEELEVMIVAREYNEPGRLPLDLVAGDVERLRKTMPEGEVVIGTILSNKLGLHVGDQVELGTSSGFQAMRIGGVATDYLAGGQTVYAEWNVASRLFGVGGADGYIIRADRDQLLELQPRLELLAKKYGVLLHSSADLANQVDRIIRGVDGFHWGLLFLAFVVAAFGVVNTLSMNVLEQTRELGLLRIVAMTKRQVRRTILMQAMIIGLIGLVPGVLSGVGVAYVMNLAMEPSFGRPIAFGFHPWLMLVTFLGAMLITIFSALIPAERAAQVNAMEALRYE